jgi:phage gpG-like protein
MVKLFGPWNWAAFTLMTASRRIKTAADRALMQEAQFLRREIVVGITKQAPGGQPFVPLADATIQRRKRGGFGGTKALIVTGDLRNSIQVTKVGTNGVFVGILRTAQHRGGELVVNIAKIHEYGAPRAHIPARPFMQPVFDLHKDKIRDRFAKNFAQNLGGVFGTGTV